MVYVLDIDGQPLMPTARHGKVRRLLNSHLAKVVKRCPFTIQLLYQSTKETQPISLGVDAGSRHIGLAATTEQKVVYQEELIPRNDVVKLLSAKRALRRSRRNRKTRYRKPRFNNRVHSKHKGWLAPSVEVKIQEHITAIKRICQILPISEIHVETAEFDLQRLKAAEAGNPLPVVQTISLENSTISTTQDNMCFIEIDIHVSAVAHMIKISSYMCTISKVDR